MVSSTSDDDLWLTELFEMETFSDNYTARALLTKQYLPNVKKGGEEFPPIFTTDTFGVEVAEALDGVRPEAAEWVHIRTRRFDGLVRHLGVPHPVAYSKLVLHIRDHWADLVGMLEDDRSQIKPQWHDDGRVIQMDYVDHADEHFHYTRLAQGKSYLVKADISNCFPSVYSHALDWALRGKAAAKEWIAVRSNKRGKSWEAKLDELSRNIANRETKGLLIGPAVSNLLSELILQRIDEKLAGYDYVRYIDDYSVYFETRREAEDFLVQLQRELAHFRLDLNTRKTRIVSLREGVGNTWIATVMSHLPAEWTDLNAARFLQQAELLAQQYPSESVLKFAVKTLTGHNERPAEGSLRVTEELMRISQFHPHVLSILSKEIGRLNDLPRPAREQLAASLRKQLARAIRSAETDSVLWLLYIIRKQLRCGLKLSQKSIDDLLNLNDDFCWLALSTLARNKSDQVERHVRNLHYIDEGDRQTHWLARYEFWRVGRINDDELSDEERTWMSVLKTKDVTFSKLKP